ncbi:MAG: crossover junction endodeoxyribonuclease RuvC [bacterium]|nr:crossover junction endodeoxyribonuclease RuvC [bacterium]
MPTASTRILGLDPGSRHTGFGIIDKTGGDLQVVRFGRFSTPAKAGLATRLASLATELETLLEDLEPACAALETPFQGLNARSLIVLSQARGALLATLARRSIEIREYSPTEVKSAVSGYGRATKAQVNRMVRQILSIRNEVPSADAADALAVAICCANRSRHDEIVGIQS